METISTNFPAIVAAVTFMAVTLTILTERLHLTVAAFLGALVLVFAHIMSLNQAIDYISQSYATLALFLGVMTAIAIILITYFWRRGWLKNTSTIQ